VRVVSPEFLFDLRKRHFKPAEGNLAESDALALARRAGASILVTGQIARLDGRLLLTWRMVETIGGKSLAAGRAQEDVLTVLADHVIADIVRQVKQHSGAPPGDAPESVASLTTENSTAYRYYVAAQLALDRSQFDEAITQLDSATELDSTFALADLALSKVYYSGTDVGIMFGKARDHANRAWRHRDRLSEKDRMRLDAWSARLDYRRDQALDLLRELHRRWPDDRAILADLQNDLFTFWYAHEALQVAQTGKRLYPADELRFGTCCMIGFEQTGQADSALVATRAFVKNHGTESQAWDELGWRFLSLGLPDSATAAFDKAIEIDHTFIASRNGLTWAAYVAGDLDEAIRRGEALLDRTDLEDGQRVDVLTSSFTWPGLCVFFAESGRFREAEAQFERAEPYLGDQVTRMRDGSSRALLYLRIGRPDKVLAWTASLREVLLESNDRPVMQLAGSYAAIYGPLALACLDSLQRAKEMMPAALERTRSFGGQATYFHRLAGIEIALREGKGKEALRLLDENDAQIQPPGGLIALMRHESRVEALLLAGQPAQALEALSELDRTFRGDKRALILRGRVLEALGRNQEAADTYRAFLTAWAGADPGVPQLAEARTRLARLAGS